MLAISFYLLKVLICSAILYGYYLLALRNKVFHRWNRFYLLAAVVISIAVPLIKIDIWQTSGDSTTRMVQMLQVVNSGDKFIENYSYSPIGTESNFSTLLILIYSLVSMLILFILVRTLIRIYKLKVTYPGKVIEGVYFRNTHAEGTPFSFFNNIFWNDRIDLNSATGNRIFRHEVAHVTEMHTHDKLFINLALIFFWCNPFFWIIRKELNMIHEFIADKKALEDGD